MPTAQREGVQPSRPTGVKRGFGRTCIMAGLLVPPPEARTALGCGMPISNSRPRMDKNRPSTPALASCPGENASSTFSSAENEHEGKRGVF